MTNHQVRLLCYALVIAAGGVTFAIGSLETKFRSGDSAIFGFIMSVIGAGLFFWETFPDLKKESTSRTATRDFSDRSK